MFVLNQDSIKSAMSRKGISSIAALARRTGVHRNTIGRFLWKREPVLPDSVSRVLEELDLEPADALERFSEPISGALSAKELVALIDDLVEAYPKAAYVLFGSRARKQARRYSDFDIGVFSRDEIDLNQYLSLLDIKEHYEDTLPWFIDLVNLNNADSSFLYSIAPDLQFLGGRCGDWQTLQARCRDEH